MAIVQVQGVDLGGGNSEGAIDMVQGDEWKGFYLAGVE